MASEAIQRVIAQSRIGNKVKTRRRRLVAQVGEVMPVLQVQVVSKSSRKGRSILLPNRYNN